MSSYVYYLDMNPEPWKRPVHYNNHVYDSQKLLKTNIGLFITKQHGSLPKWEGPLRIFLFFNIAMPEGRKGRKRVGQAHMFKPDIDNLQKLYLDAITRSGIIHDDCQFCELHASKSYARKGHIVIKIENFEENNEENSAIKDKK